ncbi:hypothetical protein BGW36DRAFT_387588 [Talaromyces proteolyticus]|uniref:Clr5 domain-containing protein n=1 Tax=Talaromyces proteolyticus TaxID=1131652 RepID=A0AAD4PWZ9_9EURO|nr:uncharacterized protein BGW36DRAFT_387588 [Talaromyces proteolyticus]KAH8692427.1 hypothetical protein BGW36DRAFT_387588 [Talaromyces proteolyticus]
MKTSIPSDVWEKKKALIARLYKDEEWPLKQVIKQIRTEDFNPSETQLRSRLKKWRVTKPSRQTRKKPVDGQPDIDDDEDDVPEEMSPVETKNVTLPTPTSLSQPQQMSHVDGHGHGHPHAHSHAQQSNRDWYSAETWQQQLPPPPQQQQSQPESIAQTVVIAPSAEQSEVAVTPTWPAPVSTSPQLSLTTERHPQMVPPQNTGSQISTPVISHFPSHGLPASYELSQQSPQSNLPANTHMVSPSYVAPYPMAPLTYPQPAPPSTIQWPMANDYIEPDVSPSTMSMPQSNWYAAQYETPNGPSTVYYPRAINPVSNNYGQVVQPMAPQDMSAYQQQSMVSYQGFDEAVPVRPWRRATSSHYNPDAAPGHVRVDRQGRQRKQVADRKRKDSAVEGVNMVSQQMQSIQSMHPAIQSAMPPQYIPAGHHSMAPQDIYAYAGHEQLLQRPVGH